MNISELISKEDLLVGLTISAFSAVDIALYIPCMIVFCDKELRSYDAYSFMFHMGVFDLLQVSMHFISGVLTIVPHDNQQHKIDWVFGGICEAAWCGYITLQVVLALNRLFHVIFREQASIVLSDIVRQVFIAFAYIYAVLWLILFWSPYCNFVFNKEIYLYYFNFAMDGCATAHSINGKMVWAQLLTMGFCYFGVVVVMRTLRTSTNQQNGEQQRRRKRESRMTFQLALLFIIHAVVMLIWQLSPVLLSMAKYHYLAITLLWIALNGANPVIYLLMNKTIRKKVFVLLRWVTVKPVNV